MLNLVLNENMKIYRRVRTWVLIGLMVALVLFVNFIEWHSDGKKAEGEGWRAALEQKNQQWSEILKQPNLGEDDRTFYQEQIVLNEYHVAQNIRSTDGTLWDGVNGSASMMIVITIFTIIIVGDSVAGDFRQGRSSCCSSVPLAGPRFSSPNIFLFCCSACCYYSLCLSYPS